MSFPVPDNSQVEVRMYGRWTDQTSINTVRFNVVTGGPNGDAQSIVDALSTLLALPFRALMSARATYLGMSIQDFPNRAWVATWSKNGAGVGAVAGDMLPSQTAGLISFRSANAKAKARGRFYIPFPAEADSTADGYPASDYQTRANAFADILVPAIALASTPAVTLEPAVMSNKLPHTMYKYIAWNFPSLWASQRRRGGFGRVNSIPLPLI